MMSLVRCCRPLAVALLLAAPGLGGTWLPLVHPCVVDAPWLAGDDHHGHDTPDLPGSEPCHCIGSSQAGSPALLPVAAAVALVSLAVERPAATPVHAPNPPVQRPADRLPPATAPPLV